MDPNREKQNQSIQEDIEYDYSISIIIPVYNTALYLPACLDSILLQSFSDIEVICIDDGSTDESLTILLDYQLQDHRIKLIKSEHSGVSVARNRGLIKAKGKYIYFMDSDDSLSTNALEILYNTIEDRRVEILYFDGTAIFDNEVLERKYNRYKNSYTRQRSYDSVVNGIEMFTLMHKNNAYYPAVSLQVFSHKYLKIRNIQFFEGIIYEDNLFSFECILNASRVSHINTPLYIRRIRDNSIITSNITYANFYGYFICWIKMMNITMSKQIPEEAQIEIIRYTSGLRSAAVRYANMLRNGVVLENIKKDSPLIRDIYYYVFQPQIVSYRIPIKKFAKRIFTRLKRV